MYCLHGRLEFGLQDFFLGERRAMLPARPVEASAYAAPRIAGVWFVVLDLQQADPLIGPG
jgi:hypothetical protein